MTSKTPAYRYRTPDRAELAAGLRELADFLTAHPEVPIPFAPRLTVFNRGGTDADRAAAVKTAADALDTEVNADGLHFEAVRMFGPLVYEIWASTDAGYADYRARTSYDESIRP